MKQNHSFFRILKRMQGRRCLVTSGAGVGERRLFPIGGGWGGAALLVPLFLMGCASSRKQMNAESSKPDQPVKVLVAEPVAINARPISGPANVSSPVVYIYKMKGDYADRVPVLMDKAKTRIVSYPHPRDLKVGDSLRLPTPLSGGYWLDNKGITPDVAFLDYTYEEYSRLPSAPTMDELMAHILDKNPLTEIRACGRRADYKDIVKELNEMIERGGTMVIRAKE